MNKGQQQIIAEKIGSTVRVLELLGFDYEITNPKRIRAKGNKSPRIVRVHVGEKKPLWVFNSAEGYTWANDHNGKPIPQVTTIEDLYVYLPEKKITMKKARKR
ncbi:MAG: hypothetical protein KC643_19135 [Nitrospira sp.]|nr:hypothetical protein [Nitrospira sp.]